MKRLGKIAGRVPAGWYVTRTALTFALFVISTLLLTSSHSNGEQGPSLFEDFNSLSGWEDFYFPKIKEHTLYSLAEEGGVTFLLANSSASASAFMLKREIDVYQTPHIRWRWKVDNVYKNGDLRTKAGDDSPLRIYVMFRYAPERATTGMKLKYGIAKALYGKYPPHASLNYIWASKEPVGTVMENAYTDRSRMIVMRSGASETGRWVEQEANIVEDYRKVFGEDPPAWARIAVMNDSDNTGESALSYIDYLEISSPPVSNASGK